MPLIKRYPNRKLYDTEAKRYVTLEGLAEMIRAGVEVEVIDYESGEDLTSLTLSQIILEQEKKQGGFLSRSLMTNLIRTGGDTIEFLMRSMPGTIPIADLVEDRIATLVGAGKLTTEQARAVSQALHVERGDLGRLEEILAGVLHRMNIPTSRDIEELRTRVSQLSEQLADLIDE